MGHLHISTDTLHPNYQKINVKIVIPILGIKKSMQGLESWLRALAVLPGSVASTHTAAYNCVTPVPGSPTPARMQEKHHLVYIE